MTTNNISFAATLYKKCVGPIKCGENNFCVGFEGDKVYCYGKPNGGCYWKENDCTTDSDCSKYTIESPKYTDGDALVCPNAGGWREDACKCEKGIQKVTQLLRLKITVTLFTLTYFVPCSHLLFLFL